MEENRCNITQVRISGISVELLSKELDKAIKGGATNISIREDRESGNNGFLYGVWLTFYRVLSKEEIKQNKIKALELQIKQLKNK